MHELRCYQYLTTRKQREAIWRLFCRLHDGHNDPLDYVSPSDTQAMHGMAFRAFRKTVHNYGDYMGVQWHGMFLGIEKDGYTHS